MGRRDKIRKYSVKALYIMRLLLLLLPVAITVTLIYAEGAEFYKGKAIGIQIEKSCLMSNCLKYKDLVFLDNSDPVYTGKFVTKGDDVMRQYRPTQNNAKWLQFAKNFTILVDPPSNVAIRIPMIYIVHQLDEFHLPTQYKTQEGKPAGLYQATERIRAYSHTRYVDATCTNAIITSKNWQTVLPDTINFLAHGCDPKYTKLDTISYEKKTLTKHDITTSKQYQYEQRIKWIKENCLKAFRACK